MSFKPDLALHLPGGRRRDGDTQVRDGKAFQNAFSKKGIGKVAAAPERQVVDDDGEPIKFLACYQKGVRVGMIHELQKRTRRKPSGVKNASIDPARAVLGDSVPQRQMTPLLPLPQGED